MLTVVVGDFLLNILLPFHRFYHLECDGSLAVIFKPAVTLLYVSRSEIARTISYFGEFPIAGYRLSHWDKDLGCQSSQVGWKGISAA